MGPRDDLRPRGSGRPTQVTELNRYAWSASGPGSAKRPGALRRGVRIPGCPCADAGRLRPGPCSGEGRGPGRRPMARAEKVAAVAELTERFQTSAGAGLAEDPCPTG